MGILVTIAAVWLTSLVAVVVTYTLGPPARRLLRLRADVAHAAEGLRHEAGQVRDHARVQLQNLEQPIAATLHDYQSARRRVLPGASRFDWSEKDLSRWEQRELAERGHALRLKNLFALVAWNLAISCVFGLSAWGYYQHIHSQARPQVRIPAAKAPGFP